MSKKDFEGKKTWSNYYWFYYKWQMIGIVFLAVAITVCTAQCMSKTDPDYLILFYSDTPFMDAYLEDTCDKISEFGEDLNGDGKVKISAVNCTYNANDYQTSQVAAGKAATQLSDNGATIWVLDEKGEKIYNEAENVDVFSEFRGADSFKNKGANVEKYKHLSEISKGPDKEYFVFIKKDADGKADKASEKLLTKLEK